MARETEDSFVNVAPAAHPQNKYPGKSASHPTTLKLEKKEF